MRILKFKSKMLLLALSGILLMACSFDREEDMKKQVYKILTISEWTEAKALGEIETALDRNDGFIHLSTAPQLAATLDFFFKDSHSLHLLQLNLDKIDETQLIYESPLPNEGKRKSPFPHLYSQLMNLQKTILRLLIPLRN